MMKKEDLKNFTFESTLCSERGVTLSAVASPARDEIRYRIRWSAMGATQYFDTIDDALARYNESVNEIYQAD